MTAVFAALFAGNQMREEMVARQRREQANDVHNPMAPMLDRNGLPGGNGLPKDGPDFANMIKKVRDLQDARVEPGELTQMTDGVSPIKSAVDLGDKLAVRTLAELDPLTLTAPCCQAGPVLVYLRNNPEHEHHAKMVECVEGLLLQSGLVPFKDGTAVPVQILEEVMSNEGRDEEWLKQCLRAAKVDFRQFKTLREVLKLPPGLLSKDRNFQFLVGSARDRMNPNGDGLEELEGGGGGDGPFGLSWGTTASVIAVAAVVVVSAVGLWRSDWMNDSGDYAD